MERPEILPPSKEQIVESASLFQHALPSHPLGISHTSLESYFEAVGKADVPTEFALVVLLSTNSRDKQINGNCSNISILLGKKLRGFGKGFYNCFGGKLERSLDEHKHPARGAVREVREETGINIALSVMEDGFVGTLNFTFADWEVNGAMKVHIYCVVLSFSHNENVESGAHSTTNADKSAKLIIQPDEIRGCDEIEPIWIKNVYDIPLHQMFADDSLWLVMLLKHYDDKLKPEFDGKMQLGPPPKLMFDAWFHFQPGGTETNRILHHFIRLNQHDGIANISSDPKSPESKYTLEKQLFHALHLNHIHSPSIKEFKENWAMANAVRRYMGEERMEYVIDVAGGHGALAALFLVLARTCHTAIVIDPAEVSGKEGIRQVWSPFWTVHHGDNKEARTKNLRYRHECLRTGLRKELEAILFGIENPPVPTSVLVTACHACQHLTDETMQIAAEYGVNVGKFKLTRVQFLTKWFNVSPTKLQRHFCQACMPCCQKDHDGWWKQTAKQMKLSIGATIDLLSAGKMLAWETGARAGIKYQVKMKLIDEKISPLQNRIILCKALERQGEVEDAKKNLAHAKLTKAYHRAHRQAGVKVVTESTQGQHEVRSSANGRGHDCDESSKARFFSTLCTGFCIGLAFSLIVTSKIRR